jgi:NAD(P)-dependent dehydrogenase (short-subunit alcohol dehydrogenase family)
MRRLRGKVAVITGGCNGIGRACVELFAREGAAVLVGDVADEAGDALVTSLEQNGHHARFLHCEATSVADNQGLMAAAVRDLGGLDILVTAAGIAHAACRSSTIDEEVARLSRDTRSRADRFLETTLAEWQTVIDVNLTGTFLAVQAAARMMKSRGTLGAIVTVASIAGKHPRVGRLAYGVSKAGVWLLTKHAAVALAESGIRVNALGPGFTDTQMTAAAQRLPNLEQDLLSTIPMGRLGTPLEIAQAALFLATDESSYITGEILHPDGGFYTD